jgi:hypothetical protein
MNFHYFLFFKYFTEVILIKIISKTYPWHKAKIKLKLSVCLTNQALYRDGVLECGYIDHVLLT